MGKKVAILSVADKRHMSMISAYSDIMDKEGIEYDLICINRYGEIIKGNEQNIYAYEFVDDLKSNRIKKLIAFEGFRRYAIRILKKNHYDFVIVWNENTAAVFSFFLSQYYKKRYCVNERDFDFFNKRVIRILYEKAVLSSSFSTTVVPNLKNYPRGYEYVVFFSKNDSIIKNCIQRNAISDKLPINLSYIGKVRFYKADRALIDAFANDDRFQLHFIGAGSEQHEEYIKQKGIKNVSLIGRYQPEETPQYLDQADIINAYYGTDFPFYKYFAPIRLGYGPALNIPMLTTKDTYMGDIGMKYGFSFGVNPDKELDSLPDELYSWYTNIDFEAFSKGCASYCEYVNNTNNIFAERFLKELM